MTGVRLGSPLRDTGVANLRETTDFTTIFGTLALYRAPWPQVRVGLELARSSAAPRVPPASTS